MQPLQGTNYQALQEQCSRVQEKILATREKLQQTLDGEAASGGSFVDHGFGAPTPRLDATRPATAELKSSCGVDDSALEDGDAADVLEESSSSDDGGADSDSDSDREATIDQQLAADECARQQAVAAPRVSDLPPPRELFTFKTESTIARTVDPLYHIPPRTRLLYSARRQN